MKRPTRKLNFLIEELICRDLEQLVPLGRRSQVVNEALRKELESIRRRKAVEKLIETRSAMQKLSSQEIVQELSQDRSTH
ncbi:MAG: hypothetical protein ACLQVJ_00405 [Syntrophobacteraceae bacterium]